MVSDAQKKASAKFDQANTKKYAIKLNMNTDRELIEHLQKVGNVQGYIKELIRQDIEKGGAAK